MPEPSATETRFSERQIAAILRRAAELQEEGGRSTSAPSGGLASKELIQIGAELGLDPACLRSAIREVETGTTPSERVGPAGGPTRVEIEREFEGELDDDAWERLVADCRRTFGKVGAATMVGSVREWTGGPDLDKVHATARSADGRTRLRAASDMSGAAFLIGFLLVFPTLIGSIGIASGNQWPVLLRATLIACLLGLSFFILRTGYSKMCRRRERAVKGLMARARDYVIAPQSERTAELANQESEVELEQRLEG